MCPNMKWDYEAKLELFKQYLILQDTTPKPSHKDLAAAMCTSYPNITARAIEGQLATIKATQAPPTPKSRKRKRPALAEEEEEEEKEEEEKNGKAKKKAPPVTFKTEEGEI